MTCSPHRFNMDQRRRDDGTYLPKCDVCGHEEVLPYLSIDVGRPAMLVSNEHITPDMEPWGYIPQYPKDEDDDLAESLGAEIIPYGDLAHIIANNVTRYSCLRRVFDTTLEAVRAITRPSILVVGSGIGGYLFDQTEIDRALAEGTNPSDLSDELLQHLFDLCEERGIVLRYIDERIARQRRHAFGLPPKHKGEGLEGDFRDAVVMLRSAVETSVELIVPRLVPEERRIRYKEFVALYKIYERAKWPRAAAFHAWVERHHEKELEENYVWLLDKQGSPRVPWWGGALVVAQSASNRKERERWSKLYHGRPRSPFTAYLKHYVLRSLDIHTGHQRTDVNDCTDWLIDRAKEYLASSGPNSHAKGAQELTALASL